MARLLGINVVQASVVKLQGNEIRMWGLRE